MNAVTYNCNAMLMAAPCACNAARFVGNSVQPIMRKCKARDPPAANTRARTHNPTNTTAAPPTGKANWNQAHRSRHPHAPRRWLDHGLQTLPSNASTWHTQAMPALTYFWCQLLWISIKPLPLFGYQIVTSFRLPNHNHFSAGKIKSLYAADIVQVTVCRFSVTNP